MYIVTKSGKKIVVDNSAIENDNYVPFQQNVGLYTDDAVLNKVYILQIQNRDYFLNGDKFELELIKEMKYDHYPTQEDILWAMSSCGVSRGGIGAVVEGYELEISFEN